MAHAVEVELPRPILEDDAAEGPRDNERPFDATDPDVVAYRISGAFFFGAAASVAAALDSIGDHPKAYVIDFSAVSVLDSTAAATIESFARKARRRGAAMFIAGARPAVRRMLLTHGVRPPHVRFRARFADALSAAHQGASAAPTPAAV